MNPVLIVFLVIIGLPIIEIYFLIEVGSSIGAIPTILMTILTAISGVSLMRIQGLQTIQKLQASVQRKESPAQEMIEGGMLLVAGVMLLIPGFISDGFGFLLLLPPLRNYLATKYIAKIQLQTKQNFQHQNDFIEGEFENLDEPRDSIEKKP